MLHREFQYPDPPDPDTAEIFRADTKLFFREDTLVAAGHYYLRADKDLNCGSASPWETFDPDPPDPPSGGGHIDWD
jgi:hypothetical protein